MTLLYIRYILNIESETEIKPDLIGKGLDMNDMELKIKLDMACNKLRVAMAKNCVTDRQAEINKKWVAMSLICSNRK